MQYETIQGFRLSPQQQRLWSLQQGGPAYGAQCALWVEGDLESEVLREAVARVVGRHEILRTTFRSPPGMTLPVQVVERGRAFAWEESDLRDVSPEEQEPQIDRLLAELRRRPFEFEQGPLLRVHLGRLSDRTHLLVLGLPSMCADAWTLRNLVRDLAEAYDACRRGKDVEKDSDEACLPYVQFSEWQHELLDDEDAEEGRGYWRRQNLVPPAAVTLPYERRAGDASAFEPEVVAVAIDDVAAQLDAVARRWGVAPAAVLLACWETLLWRLTGQAEIVVGDACDGRQHEMLYGTLGPFARWLPIRCRFQARMRFGDVLTQIAQARRDGHQWQDYFAWDDGNEPGYFPIGFECDERPGRIEAGGVAFSVYRQRCLGERFHVMLNCVRTGDRLAAEFCYDPARLEREDVERLARQFAVLLRNAVQDTEAPIEDLEILSDADRHQLLVEFNATEAGEPQEGCIHERFERQVERTPDRIAVQWGEEHLTYAALNARANRLARHLQRLGVGPEQKVALCLQRSLEMVVGVLGTLKAGAAYVPLEPTYPQQRLSLMLADTEASVVLTHQQAKPSLPPVDGHLICLDGDWETIEQERADNPASGATVDHLAYVIYTSGSTGRPKGVLVPHRAVVHLAGALRRAVYADHAGPLRVSLNAPLSFDASVKQIVQLLDGHTLHLLPEEVRPDGNALASYVRRHGLDVLDCTPAQLKLMLDAQAKAVPGAQVVLVGGEPIDEDVWRTLAADRRTRAYNVYGPTECTVDTTACDVRAVAEPSIGRPIGGARVYALDDRLRPTPIGIPGELYIGGARVARGYLNQPALTAERFVPDPFSNMPGARLYRSGDLASFRADGNLRFVGRRDHQVKVRGYRIELGEIEAVLGQHPAVRENVVALREDVPGDARLVAYVVTDPAAPESVTNDLRDHLRVQLPEYMVPSAFVPLRQLPLTRNGKVDRRALPSPEHARPKLRAAYVAPRTEIENTIAGIWQDVLQVEKVGVDDNFFDLGGHSLSMVRVHSRLREAFTKEISLIEMFRNPTVRSLAQYINDDRPQTSALDRAQARAQRRRRARNRQEQS